MEITTDIDNNHRVSSKHRITGSGHEFFLVKSNSQTILRISMQTGEMTELNPKEKTDVDFYSSHVFTFK
jgi:hypothetical protein